LANINGDYTHAGYLAGFLANISLESFKLRALSEALADDKADYGVVHSHKSGFGGLGNTHECVDGSLVNFGCNHSVAYAYLSNQRNWGKSDKSGCFLF
jgi:hypothetical protein